MSRQRVKAALAELALEQGALLVSDAVRRAKASPRYAAARRVAGAYKRLRDASQGGTVEQCRGALVEAEDAVLAFLADEDSPEPGEHSEVQPQEQGDQGEDHGGRE